MIVQRGANSSYLSATGGSCSVSWQCCSGDESVGSGSGL